MIVFDGDNIVAAGAVNFNTLAAQGFDLNSLAIQLERSTYHGLRAKLVKNIKVTIPSNKTFDGDEESQSRMGRAIIAMDDDDRVDWVLADNTVSPVSKAELLDALKMAEKEQAQIWVYDPDRRYSYDELQQLL